MLPVEIYFAFHRPARLADLRTGARITSVFGHVECFGYTVDDTWFFFDPGRLTTSLVITHLHDEVTDLMADVFQRSEEVISIEPVATFRLPLHMPMNCVTQCAALAGIRAFTPRGLRKKLLETRGARIHGTEGRPGGQEDTDAGAPSLPA
ncbi:hypothetical protein GCM10011360_17560 [Primorskyibacter flagellatus]|uniref:Uncharacterized protein n=1 Tax=Primorskyibacter flagellatus TaxID=1387277 RepID=A0A917A6L7_9RHOB|nr:hypothetical protein [Primorskyibacter flagellatus]GGE29975.1 hypothetical protein GCM10011360_17560 [Primorskyibacter flagellatus]